MSSKAKGSYGEKIVQRQLEKQGFLCTKAGASLGLFDLICVRQDSVKLCQVKYGTSRLRRKEREEIALLKVPKCCTKEYWLLKKRQKPIIEIIP